MHEFVEHDMGNRCHAHRRPRVTGIGFEGGIDLYGGDIVSFGITIGSMAVRRMNKARGKSSIVQLSEILVGSNSRPTSGLY